MQLDGSAAGRLFDLRGIRTGKFSPHLQALRVTMTADGASTEQMVQLEQAFQSRCPVFTTLVRMAPIPLNGVEIVVAGR